MIDTFVKLFKLLTPKQKREFFLLQIVMLMSSAAELIGTISIMPFIALAANPQILDSNQSLAWLNGVLGRPSHEQFLVLVGSGFVFFVVVANSLMFIAQFLMSRYSQRLGGEVSTRLYGYYLSQDIIFHSRTNSARLIQRIMRDSQQLSVGLILPTLRLLAHMFSIVLLSGLVIYVEPLVAFTTLAVLGAVYWFIFYVIRGAIYLNGKMISQYGQKRNRLLNESFGGIKDMKLYSFESGYFRDYGQTTRASNRASANNQILGEFPYYLVETVVFAGMVLLTLYLSSSDAGLHSALPVLTLFGMAGIKLVPKVQQSYKAITQIRSAQAPFRNMYEDLKESSSRNVFDEKMDENLAPNESFGLKGVTFRYDENADDIFHNFSLQIGVGEVTAIIGPSGVGKSTLLDILMGLIKPTAGCIEVDGQEIHEADLPAWRATIGYVTQEVYLTDTTPAENIAFGVEQSQIDMERVRRAASMARIDEFIESLPETYDASIGERGGQFSGGQKQRIGLARAFYRGVAVLVLDEATSALDTQTQSEILENLRASGSNITVLMVTHREETIAAADRVVSLGDISRVQLSGKNNVTSNH